MRRTAEQKAMEAGYSFTGAYSHDKEEMKKRAEEERAKGNKVMVVNCPPNPLSRGYHGMGYSVYFIESEANKEAKRKALRENEISRLKAEETKLLARLDEIKIKLSALENLNG